MLTIFEPTPDGRRSIKAIHKFFDEMDKSVSDAKDLWKDLEPGIEKSINYEFSDANPNVWKPLTNKYLNWKIKKGYPGTIGILTGALKRAVTTDAKKEFAAKYLRWRMNTKIPGYKGKLTGEYGKYFHKARQIFRYTKSWFKNNVIKIAVKIWVDKNKNVLNK